MLKQSVGPHQVVRLVLVHMFSFVVLCASSSLLAQGSTRKLDADAHQAGMFQAFRICLKQERDEGQISAEDYRRCDSTAERLYFGLYNTVYAEVRNISIAARFVSEAQKIVYAVKGDPARCQGDAEFDAVSAAVVRDSKGFYPDHPDLTCRSSLPCGITTEQAQEYKDQIARGECACPLAKWNFCGVKPQPAWMNLKNSGEPRSLSIPNAEVYTDYCTGHAVDGIMVVPKACPDGSPMRLRQFVMRSCPGHDCGVTPSTTCGDRTLDNWYLDECNGLGYYTPDTPVAGAVHVMSDEPTVSAPNRSPYEMHFYDFLMCGTQIMDVFQWTRTGVEASQVQMCTVPCKPGEKCDKVLKTMAGAYSGLAQVNIDPTKGEGAQKVFNAVCQIQNKLQFLKDPGVNAILTAAGCGNAR